MLSTAAKWYLRKQLPKDPAGQIDFALSSFVDARDNLKRTLDVIARHEDENAAELAEQEYQLALLKARKDEENRNLHVHRTRAVTAIDRLSEILGDERPIRAA